MTKRKKRASKKTTPLKALVVSVNQDHPVVVAPGDRVFASDGTKNPPKLGTVMLTETDRDGLNTLLVLLDEDKEERLLTTFYPWCLQKASVVDDVAHL